MNNEGLKKKIVEIVNDGIIHGEDNFGMPTSKTIENIADALISAGIGDVKEAEHRVARAEKALEERATYCAMEDLDYFSLTTVAVEARAKELYNGWVQQAEKELQEEKKSD